MTKPLPEVVRLEVPYRSQLDNDRNPFGSCNVTSVAMCLSFLGIEPRTTAPQFEDELYEYAELMGYSRHLGEDLAAIGRDYGAPHRFTRTASLSEVKTHLADGKPCIFHGYFTDYGHIIAVVGYDETGFLVHDPYGEWYAEGYDRNTPENETKGRFLHYSYEMISRTCVGDGDFWVHFVG